MSIERIKFRGKATKRFQILTEHDVFLRTIEFGQWVTIDNFIGAENTALANSDADRFTKFFKHVAVGLIDPTTIGQWTGLVDSKGVEIYEGDVVRIPWEDGFDDNAVVWDVKNAIWAIAECDDLRPFGCFDLFYKDSPEVTVIGNVHEVTT